MLINKLTSIQIGELENDAAEIAMLWRDMCPSAYKERIDEIIRNVHDRHGDDAEAFVIGFAIKELLGYMETEKTEAERESWLKDALDLAAYLTKLVAPSTAIF